MKVQSPLSDACFCKFFLMSRHRITDGAKRYTISLDAVGVATDKVNKKRFLVGGFSPSLPVSCYYHRRNQDVCRRLLLSTWEFNVILILHE
jgi:hypothetical protein